MSLKGVEKPLFYCIISAIPVIPGVLSPSDSSKPDPDLQFSQQCINHLVTFKNKKGQPDSDQRHLELGALAGEQKQSRRKKKKPRGLEQMSFKKYR